MSYEFFFAWIVFNANIQYFTTNFSRKNLIFYNSAHFMWEWNGHYLSVGKEWAFMLKENWRNNHSTVSGHNKYKF